VAPTPRQWHPHRARGTHVAPRPRLRRRHRHPPRAPQSLDRVVCVRHGLKAVAPGRGTGVVGRASRPSPGATVFSPHFARVSGRGVSAVGWGSVDARAWSSKDVSQTAPFPSRRGGLARGRVGGGQPVSKCSAARRWASWRNSGCRGHVVERCSTTRRAETTTRAAILISLVRIVVTWAAASSVPTSTVRRSVCISTYAAELSSRRTFKGPLRFLEPYPLSTLMEGQPKTTNTRILQIVYNQHATP